MMSGDHNTDPAMVSGFGKYHSDEPKAEKRRPYTTIDLESIRSMVDSPPSVPKDNAQWVIPSTLKRRSKEAQKQSGEYWALWSEFDIGPVPVGEVDWVVDFVVLGGVDREIYNTRSATVEVPKSRLIVPLDKPLSGANWMEAQEVLCELLKTAGLNPDESANGPTQIMYLPNRGTLYETISRRTGNCFDPMAAWGPRIAARREEVAQGEREQAEKREAARLRREAMAQESGTGRRSVIDTFNRSYTPADIMIMKGYDQRGNTFRHPASESGSFSASVRVGDDGLERVHTMSSADKLYTDGGGVGAHSAFSAFAALFHGGDKGLACTDAGDNWLKIGDESFNAVERREFARKKGEAPDPFSATDEEEVEADTGEIKPPHPLAKFVDIAGEPRAPDWILPGFVGTGLVAIAGSHGVGKTTTLLPLAMAAAGLHEFGYELAPKHWRHVVYVTEDIPQAQRIVAGMLGSVSMGLDSAMVGARLHLVDAVRLDVKVVANVGAFYRERFTRTVGDVQVLPLVVIDTKAAVINMDDENSNSEASKIVNTLKQGFAGLPTWIVGHVAKQTVGRADLASLSMRGGSAFEADANQCLYLVKEGADGFEQRYLVRGKTRFEATWPELAIEGFTTNSMAKDAFGDPEPVTLRWAIAAPGLRTRAQARAVAQEDARGEVEAQATEEVLEAVGAAWAAGMPMNKAAVRRAIRRSGTTVLNCIELLLASGRLFEVTVPSGIRTNPNRGSFLVSLSEAEAAEFVQSGVIPDAKKAIPPSWRNDAKT